MGNVLEGLQGITNFGGVGLLVAAATLLFGRILVPAAERRHLRFPALALFLHIGVLALRWVLPADAHAQHGLELTALLLLLLSIGRSGFLVLVHSVFRRRATRPMPKIFRDILQAGIYAGVLMVVLRAAGVEMGSLLTTSALLTAVIGLSLQDTLGNLFAGLAIQAQRPFEVGDWIQFDSDEDNIGMVTEINWRAAKVLTIQQIEITVPNSTLAKASIRNFTKPTHEARRSVVAHAPYHIPLRRVQAALLQAARSVDGVLAKPDPSVIPSGFDERGVRYEVRYFVSDFQRRDVIAGEVRDRVWYALARAAIEIPVPQRTIQMLDASSVAEDKERHAELVARESYLRKVDFLHALPDYAIHTLAEMSETRLYDQTESIIRQGDEGDELFILRRGEVAVLLEENGGARVEVARLKPGQFFGEMGLMTGAARRATVRAVGETEVLVVGKGAFSKVFDAHPELVQHVCDVLAEREERLVELEEDGAAREPSQAGDAQKQVLLSRIRDFFSL